MGTRADFYTRKDNQMKWLGSIAYDGYPDGIDKKVLESKTQEDFELNTNDFLLSKDSRTMPEEGWPWPWEDSRTTDFAYIFENGKVMASCFGHSLFDPLSKKERKNKGNAPKLKDYFPDMTGVQKVKMPGTQGSGNIMIVY